MSAGGYLSGNMLVPYPFEDGQSIDWDISGQESSSSSGDAIAEPDLNEAMVSLQRCFVDAFMFLDSESVSEWPSIGNMSVSGNSLSFSVSANGKSIDVKAEASGDRFPIISYATEFGRFLVVVSSEGIRDFSSFCDGNGIRPAINNFPPSRDSSSSSSGDGGNYSLRLCARCVSMRPAGLGTIRVYDGVHTMETGPHFVIDGDVTLLPGNNMVLSEPESANGIQLDAVPGAGMGVVACECNENYGIGSNLAGPDGHVRLFNDTCYDLEPGPEGTVVVDGVAVRSRDLLVHAKCTACCTCEMYESIVNGRLVELANAVRKAKGDIGDLLKSYEKGVKEFNGRIAVPRLSDVSLALSGMPAGSNLSSKLDGTLVKGKMGRCAFNAVVRNSSFATISAKIVSMSGSDSIVEASASWTEASGTSKSKTSHSSLSGTFPIPPGGSLAVSFVSVKGAQMSSVKTLSFTGSISVSLSYRTLSGKSGSLGTLSKSITV